MPQNWRGYKHAAQRFEKNIFQTPKGTLRTTAPYLNKLS